MSARRPSPTWIGVALGLAATAALSVLVAATARPARGGATDIEAVRNARYAVERRRELALEARDRAQQAESVMRVLGTHAWNGDSLLVLADARMPAWQRQFATTQLRRSWAALAPRRDGLRVAVAFVPVASRTAGLRASPFGVLALTGTILPELLDGRTCLILKPWQATREPTAAQLATLEAQWLDESAVPPPAARRSSSWPLDELGLPAQRASLGACGWLAAHGQPGRGTRAWLDSTAWRAAAQARFVDTPRARAPWLVEFAGAAGPTIMLDIMTTGYASEVLPAQACARGNVEACRRYLFQSDSLATERGATDLERRVLVGNHIRYAGLGPVEALDPRPRFLDDLRREIGAERFGALWKSDAAFADAFAAATGHSLDAWTARWMANAVRGSRWVAGPTPSLGSIAVWAPFLLVLLWSAVGRVSRRQVGRGS